MTFLTIGIWHPIVIKTEYNWGIRLSSFLGVFGASALWGIGELFAQKKRVEKGWFLMNPKRKTCYTSDKQ